MTKWIEVRTYNPINHLLGEWSVIRADTITCVSWSDGHPLLHTSPESSFVPIDRRPLADYEKSRRRGVFEWMETNMTTLSDEEVSKAILSLDGVLERETAESPVSERETTENVTIHIQGPPQGHFCTYCGNPCG